MAYLDNSATTKPDKAVADKIYEMLTVNFGNPSSFHKEGLNANLELRAAREKIANALSCESEEIYFTSGGTEANNLAILGAAEAGKRKGKRIVTTAIEHESVLQSVDELEKQGFEVIRLMPDKQGRITEQQVFDAVNSDTILVSMMYVNNEVGSIMPVKSIKKAVKRANAPALIHIDCVQAFGKLEVKPSKLGADLVTVTAHKIHGPKGVGALYLKKGTRILRRRAGKKAPSRNGGNSAYRRFRCCRRPHSRFEKAKRKDQGNQHLRKRGLALGAGCQNQQRRRCKRLHYQSFCADIYDKPNGCSAFIVKIRRLCFKRLGMCKG